MASNKKQIGKNQPPPPKTGSQAEAKKLIGAVNTNQLLIEEVLPNFVSPTWIEQDFCDLHLSILEGSRDRFAALVEQMASFGKALNVANDFVKTKSEKLTSESVQIEINRYELLQLKEACEKRATDLDEKELLLTIKNGENASKERELEKRELDARSGFSAQNVAALSDLKKEIVELESKKTEIQLGILQSEQNARDDESARTSELMEREAEIANKERGLQQQQRRLDAEQFTELKPVE